MKIIRLAQVINIYQGRNQYNKSSRFYTTDMEWARQFTQSGLDKEIARFSMDSNDIYRSDELPHATDEKSFDKGVMDAKEKGYKALWIDEGVGQPNSIYVLDKSVLRG